MTLSVSTVNDENGYVRKTGADQSCCSSQMCVQAANARSANCRELLTGETVAAQHKNTHITCDIAVPPYDVRVLALTYSA